MNALDKIPWEEAYKDILQPAARIIGKVLAFPFDSVYSHLILPVDRINRIKKIRIEEQLSKFVQEYKKNISEKDQISVEEEFGEKVFEGFAGNKDEEIKVKYRNLLQRACSMKFSKTLHPSYPDILESLTPDEIWILDYLIKTNISYISSYQMSIGGPLPDNFPNLLMMSPKEIGTRFKIPEELSLAGHEIEFYLENLIRTGLIKMQSIMWLEIKNRGQLNDPQFIEDVHRILPGFMEDDDMMARYSELLDKKERIGLVIGECELSHFGYIFVKSCSEIKQTKN